uniref:hypothetical protein n=1 Tax=Paracoccus sp. T5 TaxID=3402161 RepID=UPI003AF49215
MSPELVPHFPEQDRSNCLVRRKSNADDCKVSIPGRTSCGKAVRYGKQRFRIEIMLCHLKVRSQLAALAQNRWPKFFPSAIAPAVMYLHGRH